MKIIAFEEQYRQELRELFLQSRRATFHWANIETFTLQDFDDQTMDEDIFIAIQQNDVLGFIALYKPARFIHHLFIAPAAMKQGVGKALVQFAITHYKHPLSLKCVVANTDALAFYEALGWKKIRKEGSSEPYWYMEYCDENKGV